MVSVAPSEGFDRLYVDHAHRVRGLVRKLVGDEDLADDIVQETFLRAYRCGLHVEAAHGAPDLSPWPWLAAVARHLAVDALRRRATRPCGELTPHVLRRAAGGLGDDPVAELFHARRREGVGEVLESVSPRHRRILLLKDFEGRPCEEVANLEGLSVRALKSVLARARRTFRERYSPIAEERGLDAVFGFHLVRSIRERAQAARLRTAAGLDLATHTPLMTGGGMQAAASVGVLGALALGGLVGQAPLDHRHAAAPRPGAEVRYSPIRAAHAAPPALRPGTTVETLGDPDDSLAPRPDDGVEEGPRPSGDIPAPAAPVVPYAPAGAGDGLDATTTERPNLADTLPDGPTPAPAPASSGDAEVEQEPDGSTSVSVETAQTAFQDGPPESELAADVWVKCSPEGEKGVTKRVACTALESAGDTPSP